MFLLSHPTVTIWLKTSRRGAGATSPTCHSGQGGVHESGMWPITSVTKRIIASLPRRFRRLGMFDHYPIHELIESQQKRLGLRRNELARRCGFKNIEKGLRRIDGVCHGDLDSPGAKMVLDNLAVALEVDKNVVERPSPPPPKSSPRPTVLPKRNETRLGGNRSSLTPILSVQRIVLLKSPSTV